MNQLRWRYGGESIKNERQHFEDDNKNMYKNIFYIYKKNTYSGWDRQILSLPCPLIGAGKTS